MLEEVYHGKNVPMPVKSHIVFSLEPEQSESKAVLTQSVAHIFAGSPKGQIAVTCRTPGQSSPGHGGQVVFSALLCTCRVPQLSLLACEGSCLLPYQLKQGKNLLIKSLL